MEFCIMPDKNPGKTDFAAPVLGVTVNIALAAFKMAAGFITGSRSLIADGFNNAGDILTSVLTLIGGNLAKKPSDADHPYGHQKAEYIFSLIISFSMLTVAYQTIYGSVQSMVAGERFEFSWSLIYISLASVALKLIIYIIAQRSAKKRGSLMMTAMAEDSRNDMFISTAVAAGIGAAHFGVYWLDPVLGILISVWIVYSALKIFGGAYKVLMDTDVSDTFKTELSEAIRGIDRVDHVDSILAKPVGTSYILIVKISVDGGMSVNDSHAVAGEIRALLRGKKHISDVVVHVNPA